MSEYAISASKMSKLRFAADKQHKVTLGGRLLQWIEAGQQRKADREISRILRDGGC